MANITLEEFKIDDQHLEKLRTNLNSIGIGVGIDTVKNDCRVGKLKGMNDDVLGDNMRIVLLDFKEFQSIRPLFPQKDAAPANKPSITSTYQYVSLFFLNLDTLRLCSMLIKTYGVGEFWRGVRNLSDVANVENNISVANTIFELSFRSKSNKEKYDGLVPQFQFAKIAGEYASNISTDGKLKNIQVEVLPKAVTDIITQWRSVNESNIFDKNVFLEYARINRPQEYQAIDAAFAQNPDAVQRIALKAAMAFYGREIPTFDVKPLFDFDALALQNPNLQLPPAK